MDKTINRVLVGALIVLLASSLHARINLYHIEEKMQERLTYLEKEVETLENHPAIIAYLKCTDDNDNQVPECIAWELRKLHND